MHRKRLIADYTERVLEGMGLVVLHSGHFSKIFKKLMGTSCALYWRSVGERERIWVVNPAHPIAAGLGEYFEIPHAEMYGEPFDIPEPDSLVFVSWFQGGEIFRSGCCYYRGHGKVFYFRPGDQIYPIYHQREVLHVIKNAALWAAPSGGSGWESDSTTGKAAQRVEPLEAELPGRRLHSSPRARWFRFSSAPEDREAASRKLLRRLDLSLIHI